VADSLWVLIAAAGKATLLQRTLSSLAEAQKPVSYCGTLIVENGQRCGIKEVVHGFASEHRFQHLYVPQANKSHALNCALTQLGDSLVFMTDDDVRLDSKVLMAYDEAARNCRGGQFYGGPVQIDAEHGLPPAWMRRYYPLTIVEPWTLPHETTSAVSGQTFMGTNWAAFAHDLRAIGGFDTRLGPGGTTTAAGQETEAQRRLLARGANAVYVPKAVAWHYLHREFLDPAWVLKRSYRHALEWGIRRTRGEKWPAITIARAALGRLNAYAKAAALRLLGGQQRRFAAEFHEVKWRGRWDGLWLGMHWDEQPQFSTPAASDTSARAA